MRKLLLLALLVGSTIPSWANAAYDSTNACQNYNNSSTSSLSCSTTSSVVSGEWIFITFAYDGSALTTSVSDTNGTPVACSASTGGSIGNIAQQSSGATFGIWCEPNAASGTHDITVTFPASQPYNSMSVAPFTGLNTAGTIDATCKGVTSSSNPTCSTTLTPSAANGAVFAFGDCNGGTEMTAGSGFTRINNTSTYCGAAEYQIPTSTSAVTVAMTGGSSDTPSIIGLSVPVPSAASVRHRVWVITQ